MCLLFRFFNCCVFDVVYDCGDGDGDGDDDDDDDDDAAADDDGGTVGAGCFVVTDIAIYVSGDDDDYYDIVINIVIDIELVIDSVCC